MFLVFSSVNVSIFHRSWLDTFWADLYLLCAWGGGPPAHMFWSPFVGGAILPPWECTLWLQRMAVPCIFTSQNVYFSPTHFAFYCRWCLHLSQTILKKSMRPRSMLFFSFPFRNIYYTSVYMYELAQCHKLSLLFTHVFLLP